MTPSVRKKSFFSLVKTKPIISEKKLFFLTEEKMVFGKRHTNLWVLDALGIYIYVVWYMTIYRGREMTANGKGPGSIQLSISPSKKRETCDPAGLMAKSTLFSWGINLINPNAWWWNPRLSICSPTIVYSHVTHLLFLVTSSHVTCVKRLSPVCLIQLFSWLGQSNLWNVFEYGNGDCQSKWIKTYEIIWFFIWHFFLPGWRSSLERSRFSAAGRHPQSMRTPPGAAPGASTPNEETQSGRFLGLQGGLKSWIPKSPMGLKLSSMTWMIWGSPILVGKFDLTYVI